MWASIGVKVQKISLTSMSPLQTAMGRNSTRLLTRRHRVFQEAYGQKENVMRINPEPATRVRALHNIVTEN